MSHATEFDFDHWATLAREDPAQFERDRRAAIALVLRRIPVRRRRRLRCLQWRIDQIRCTSRTPLAACIRLSQMMWESVHGEHGLAAILRDPGPQPRTMAVVLPFRQQPRAN